MCIYAASNLRSWRQVIVDQLVSTGIARKNAVRKVSALVGLDAAHNLNAMNKIGAASGLVSAAVNTLRHG